MCGFDTTDMIGSAEVTSVLYLKLESDFNIRAPRTDGSIDYVFPIYRQE